ncbi:MAG: hypothetical protein OEV87_12990 [Phycisphaerae bacterium]|nr:hypothetical protein [Phycisphaerae bacterium]
MAKENDKPKILTKLRHGRPATVSLLADCRCFENENSSRGLKGHDIIAQPNGLGCGLPPISERPERAV